MLRKWLPLVLLFLSSCQSSKEQPYAKLRDGLNNWFRTPYIDSQPFDIYFASNRATVGRAMACSNSVFTVETGRSLNYGLCRVQVPVNRPVGSLSSSSDPNSDTQINFQIAQNEGLDPSEFSLSLATHPSDEILIFVHGFNVRFEEAIFRAAQLGFDGKYQGQVILFSWPSGAKERMIQGPFLLRTYQENKRNAAASIAAFERVLLMALNTKKRVHLVVHSMGHQVVLPALAHLASQVPSGAIKELILNAPDYAISDFQQILPEVRKITGRITIYCSPSDNALVASQKVNRNARLGTCGLFEGVDVIDVSEVDKPLFGVGGLGHGYYSGRPIIADAAQLLLGMDAPRRMFIKRSVPALHANYILRP